MCFILTLGVGNEQDDKETICYWIQLCWWISDPSFARWARRELYSQDTGIDPGCTSFRIAVVEALQLNKTLHLCCRDPRLTDDEVKHLTAVVKKNY
jgi:hypothetical protein